MDTRYVCAPGATCLFGACACFVCVCVVYCMRNITFFSQTPSRLAIASIASIACRMASFDAVRSTHHYALTTHTLHTWRLHDTILHISSSFICCVESVKRKQVHIKHTHDTHHDTPTKSRSHGTPNRETRKCLLPEYYYDVDGSHHARFFARKQNGHSNTTARVRQHRNGTQSARYNMAGGMHLRNVCGTATMTVL